MLLSLPEFFCFETCCTCRENHFIHRHRKIIFFSTNLLCFRVIRNLRLMFHGPGLWMYWPRISQNNFDLFCLPNAMIQEPRAVTLDRNLAHVSTLLDYFLMIGHARLDVPIMPFCLFCLGPWWSWPDRADGLAVRASIQGESKIHG